MKLEIHHPSRRLALLCLLAAQILWACQPVRSTSAPVLPSTPAPTPAQAELDSTPGTSGGAAGCLYVWATRELPVLSEELQRGLAAIGAEYESSAYAFGEDCQQADGTTTFLAMETDFRVRIAAVSLKDKAALGDAIRKVMRVVGDLPPSEIPGTQPGRVEFEFYAATTDSLRLNVDISRFLSEAQDLQGSELFEHFQPPP